MGLDNPIHIAFLLVLMLLIFGARRLPEMGRSLGSGLRGFKDALGGEGAQSLLAAQHAPGAAAVSAAASASVPGASASAAEGPDVAPAPPAPSVLP
jgi:sec-independent protein translocase protein TatA